MAGRERFRPGVAKKFKGRGEEVYRFQVETNRERRGRGEEDEDAARGWKGKKRERKATKERAPPLLFQSISMTLPRFVVH